MRWRAGLRDCVGGVGTSSCFSRGAGGGGACEHPFKSRPSLCACGMLDGFRAVCVRRCQAEVGADICARLRHAGAPAKAGPRPSICAGTADGRCSGTPAGSFGLGWNGRLDARASARSKVRRHLREQPPNLSPASQTPRKQEADSGDGRERAASKQTSQRWKQTGGETPAGQEAEQNRPLATRCSLAAKEPICRPRTAGDGTKSRHIRLVKPRLHRHACCAAPVWR